MSSTRDRLGDQETFRRLVSGTIGTEFEEDSATSLSAFALSHGTVEHVVLRNVSRLAEACFSASAIRTLDIGGNISGSQTIASKTQLETLVLRYSDVVSVRSSLKYMLSETRLGMAEGAVYVPDNLVDRYVPAVNYGVTSPASRAAHMSERDYIIIRPLSKYPSSDFSTIDASWADIVADVNAGVHADRYFVGDTKLLELSDGNHVYMELVAVDSDTLSSDGSSKAAMTWLCHGICPYVMNLDQTVGNDWPDTSLRAWLEDELLPTFPAILRRNVKRVRKHYRQPSTGETVNYGVSDDVVWVPSIHEVMSATAHDGSPDVQYYTRNGMETYRCNPGMTVNGFWTRDRSNGTGHYYVTKNGRSYSTSYYSTQPNNSAYIVNFGFCL